MTEMTREERELFNAQADHEVWSLAHKNLEPWVQTTRAIGSDELTQVMEKALAEVEGEVNCTLDVLEPLRENMSSEAPVSEQSYREVLEDLAVSRGLDSAEDLARKAAEVDSSYTAKELLESPPEGFGTALNAVLNMNDGERQCLTNAFIRTFLS